MNPLPPLHTCTECKQGHYDAEGRKALNDHHLYCAECGQLVPYEYMLLPSVWQATGLDYHAGVLHLECVEKLLGRELQIDDFSDKPSRGGNNINDGIRFGMRMAQRETAPNER